MFVISLISKFSAVNILKPAASKIDSELSSAGSITIFKSRIIIPADAKTIPSESVKSTSPSVPNMFQSRIVHLYLIPVNRNHIRIYNRFNLCSIGEELQ